MERYFSMTEQCKALFGKKLYRLSLDGGFTCPNRTEGKGGCIFCSEGGSGDFSEKCEDVDTAIENAKKRISAKANNCGYIAYFQAFTGTFAPISRLRELYLPVAEREDIDLISIATRPDCIGDDVLKVLLEIKEKKPLWVELGLQTANDKTARFINRGYETKTYLEAAKKLNANGIGVITHAIIGLPNETDEDLINTIKLINESGSIGVKLQLLHVLKNTRMFEFYERGEYTPLEMEDYFSKLALCLENLNKDIAIHRMTGDGDKRTLAAPMWSADKKLVLNSLSRYLEEHDVIQGKALGEMI